MKELKLEVGKTYRNRNGEEVKIVRKGNTGDFHYQGIDLEWYTEKGRYTYSGPEHPLDLIEEVTVSDANQKHNEMEVLALQVGKTYRNRKGEEVRIVKKRDKYRYPCDGSDGRWYTESGRCDAFGREHPCDLIEEVPAKATRHTFAIPDGVKKVTVEQVSNRIVVKMVPEKGPKPGDVMVNTYGSVYIFKEVGVGVGHIYFALLGSLGRLKYNNATIPGRPATPEESQPLWDALKKAGKRWNPEAMKVEEIPESTRIREWMKGRVPDGYYTYQGIAYVIENYLKYREGEK